MVTLRRGMDRATLDAAYDNTDAVADSQVYRQRWWDDSAAIRADARSRLDVDRRLQQGFAPGEMGFRDQVARQQS
jgi:arylformamidase